MDPAARPRSIVGCASQALGSALRQATTEVTSFVRRCHSSRADLAPVLRELSELRMVLQLLNDHEAQGGAVPGPLQSHLGPIIKNCMAVVSKVDKVLRRQDATEWTVEARDEVRELAKLLGVHRGVMGLVSDLISILVSRGASPSDQDRSEIRGLLAELQTLGSSMVISYGNANLAREHFALQVHLGQIVTCTETLSQAASCQDAAKIFDEAQHQASMESLGREVRRSIAMPAPLSRGHSADDQPVAAAELCHSGLYNPRRPGDPDAQDAHRPPSLFSTPDRTPDQRPPATMETAGPSGTGFIVMDGFFRPAHDGETSPRTPFYGEHQRLDPQSRGVPGSEPEPSWRSSDDQDSVERWTRCVTTSVSNTTPPTPRASTAGLQAQVSSEKELVMEESISDEALAFAQVPIHVLDRLSLDLVGHLYGAPPTDDLRSPRQAFATTTAMTATSSTTTTTTTTTRNFRDDDARDNSDAAWNNTSNARGLRDVPLEFSLIKWAQTPPTPTSHPQFQTSSRPQTPPGHHQSPQGSPQLTIQSPSHDIYEATFQASGFPVSRPASRPSLASIRSSPVLPSQQNNQGPVGRSGLREVDSMSTMNAHLYMSEKELPRAPLFYIPNYPGPFVKKKVVVVGNFSCGKTSMIARMARGEYPKNKNDDIRITETVKLSVDESPLELCLWDIRGHDYDPTWLHNAHVALICFSVNIGSTDPKGKHLGRWVAEVNRNCPGAAILLVGLKADLRFHARTVEKLVRTGKALVTPEQGEQFRENIGATRYVECSARSGAGVQDLLGATARVAMQVQWDKSSARKGSTVRRLSRIGKFFGMGGGQD